jgi:hypothetical protein
MTLYPKEVVEAMKSIGHIRAMLSVGNIAIKQVNEEAGKLSDSLFLDHIYPMLNDLEKKIMEIKLEDVEAAGLQTFRKITV